MDAQAARAAAVRMLSLREHSAHELHVKLLGKGYSAELADAALAWCQEHDLQSEQRFVQAFVRQRLGRLYGPRRIRAELMAKGIAEHDVKAALAEHADDWLAAAHRFVARKHVDLSNYQQRGKLYQALLRRGFTSEQAGRVLRGAPDDQD